jgi:hypothetical protein
VDEGLVLVARRLKKWRKLRGDEWAAERARKQDEADAEEERVSEERAAAERAAAGAEVEAEERRTEAARAAEKRARLARARLIVISDDDEEEGEGIAAAAATATATTPAADAAAATTTVADPAVVLEPGAGEETGPRTDAVNEAGADEGDQDSVRTVWGTDGVTPIGVIKAGATSAETGGRRVVVEVPPVMKHRVPRMTALPHGYSSWEEVRRGAAAGRGRGRRVGVGADVELRAARQPGDKVSC